MLLDIAYKGIPLAYLLIAIFSLVLLVLLHAIAKGIYHIVTHWKYTDSDVISATFWLSLVSLILGWLIQFIYFNYL